jgi:hypothetical protein
MSFTMISIVRNLLQIPDQGHDILHSIARYKEIADAVNTDRLIPSATAVITLAKVICVHISFLHYLSADS